MAHRKWVPALAAASMLSAGASAARAADLPVPPTSIGLNLAPLGPARRDRAFANLAAGSGWQSTTAKSPKLGPEDADQNGNLKRLPGDKTVFRMINLPSAETKSATIRCTWDGRGAVKITGRGASGSGTGNGTLSFRWTNSGDYKGSMLMLQVSGMDAANPIRNLDCRETTMPRTARFDPVFLAMLRGFKIVRFMDWQNVNTNKPVTWATRPGAGSIDVKDDGVSIEDMLALTREAGVDPWFNMPWNADDDYIERFARLVHDSLPANHHVYVELANEVWNAKFPVSRQSLAEGKAAGLSDDQEQQRAFRYTQKLQHVMDIWSKVFADRPSSLVRVANWQNGGNRSAGVLAHDDTYKHIDALATAPYFGADFRSHPPADADAGFVQLNESMDATLGRALAAKAAAAKYGKRYIAYEAGQHIILRDDKLAAQMQRDPRMYDAYKRYLSIWREKIGDTIMMYTSVQPVLKWGGFGMLEYAGQPLSDAPKMRAVRDALQQQ